MDILEIHNYFKNRVSEIKVICECVNPWGFLCCSAFIDYLVNAIYKKSNATNYKDFIIKYLSEINHLYADFEYSKDKKKDLPEQMYYILRCGIVHSFSLVPDKKAKKNGGRQRSILLSHDKNNDGYTHLEAFTKGDFDSVIFTAESFASDLEKLVEKIFTEIVVKKPEIKENIISWWGKNKPISIIIYRNQK